MYVALCFLANRGVSGEKESRDSVVSAPLDDLVDDDVVMVWFGLFGFMA